MHSIITKKRLVNSGFIQVITFAVSGILQLAVTLLIAQQYDSDTLGIIGIVAIINLFGFSLAEAGVFNYVIYKKNISKVDFSTIQWTVLILSTLMSLLSTTIFIFEYPPVICYSVVLSSLCFPILSLGVVQYSKLICDYRFKDIFLIELFFRLSFIILVYLFELYNVFYYEIYGYMFSVILSYLVRLILIKVRTNDYDFISYGFYFRKSVFLSFLKFYTSQIGSNAINAFGNKADEIMILHYLGLSSLGKYFIIKQLIMQVFSALYQIKRRLIMPLWSTGKESMINKCIFLSLVLVSIMSLFVFSILHAFMFLDKFDSISHNSNVIIIVTSMVALRYMAGNLQCAYFQVVGKPYVELYWNMIQTLSIIVSTFIFVFFMNVHELEILILGICFIYYLTGLVGFFYFKHHGLRLNLSLFVFLLSFQFFLIGLIDF
ncbi:TPA: oligosaccharide flippase family protein [Vibrio cholerae]